MKLSDTLLTNGGFRVTCAHCFKDSAEVDFDSVRGQNIPNAIKTVGYKFIPTSEGGGIVVCSDWCAWRFGKASGIHNLLNKIFQKSSLFKS